MKRLLPIQVIHMKASRNTHGLAQYLSSSADLFTILIS